MLTAVLSVAIVITLTTTLILTTRFRNVECKGPLATSLFTFLAILFTSGLDVGLIMFPLADFPLYENDSLYAFTNPLAVEFGFWGFLVWGFYFLTTFYFCIIEPRLGLFEIPVVRLVNNLVIFGTCAFTAYLFLSYLPTYVEGIGQPLRYGLVAATVLLAAFSSTDIRYVKVLSVGSTWLFFALIAGLWLAVPSGIAGPLQAMGSIGSYFEHLPRFVLPLSDYHEWYLFWWFAWSIMIGQFVARFASGLPAWQLLLALLVVPSIPIAIWFSVLYSWYTGGFAIGPAWTFAMVAVGVVFVINSLDSLIRLYTQNLQLTPERFGKPRYVLFNWLSIGVVVLLYQLTPLQIQWVGLVVVGLYAFVYVAVYRQRAKLTAI